MRVCAGRSKEAEREGAQVKLFGVEGEPFTQGVEFKRRTWKATLYDTSSYLPSPPHWLWEIDFPRVARLQGARYYTTALGARDALVRAVKRLGMRVGRAVRK